MVNIERKNLKKRKSKGSHIKRYGIDFYVSKITQAGDTQPQLYISLREPDGTPFQPKDGSRPSARPYGDAEHLEKAHAAMESLTGCGKGFCRKQHRCCYYCSCRKMNAERCMAEEMLTEREKSSCEMR